MERSDRALLLFARSPHAEAGAKGLPTEGGTRLFLALLASWEKAARCAGVRLVVATPAACRPWMENSAIGRDAVLLTQEGGAFGARLEASAKAAMSLGFGKLVVVGGDTPAVSADELVGIFEKLDHHVHSCVLGPSEDGGVYLIGLSRPALTVLGAMSLRSRDLFELSLERLASDGFEVHVLARRGEVDSPEDVRRAWREARSEALWEMYRSLLADVLAPDRRYGPSRAPLSLSDATLRLPARAPPAAA